MSFVSGTIVLALCLALSAPAGAAVPTLAVSFDDTGVGGSSGAGVMIGWRFSTTSSIRVSELGFWDQNGDGLNESHSVGIWSTSGPGTAADALVTGTVSAGTVNVLRPSLFRMAFVTPVVLPAGDYVIGGLLGDAAEPYKETPNVGGFTQAAGITYIQRRFIGAVSGFSRPENTASGLGTFGPNFAFDVVPEPSSVAVAAVALAGLAGRGSRRRKQSR
jgi:hypothetical protein